MATITPKPVKVFSREEPVTKVDLHNCFYQGGKFVPRAVVEARGEIGLNAIKYLKKQGLATAYEGVNVDWWQLTAEGETWLRDGLKRHLEIHPDQTHLVREMPRVASPVRRRQKP